MTERIDFHSALPDVVWPAIALSPAASVLGVLLQLERTQWWAPEVLAEHQLSQLSLVVEHARSHVALYADRLGDVSSSPGRAIDPSEWARVPVLTRAQAQMGQAQGGQAQGEQAQGEQALLEAAYVPPDHGASFDLTTSGSTGRPLRTKGTQVTQLFWQALTLRDHLWHDRDFTQTLAVIRQFTDPGIPPTGGSIAANWGPATAGIIRTGPVAALSIDHPVSVQAEWLSQTAPGYLLSYPSNVAALAAHFLVSQERLDGLREVRTIGEALDPQVRSVCEDAWGVPVVDTYSSQEVGYIGLQCPTGSGYHVQSEHLLVEVLDDAGKLCSSGQTGRVVVSTLHNFATPLLRYEIGDYAEVGELCPCGRGLPLLNRVLGRQRNMFTLPDGGQVWPTSGDAATYRATFGTLPRLRQFQVIQRRIDLVEMLVVAERRFNAEEEALVHAYLRKTLGYDFAAVFTYVDEIPRSAGGKYEDFRSEVASSEVASSGLGL